MYCIYGTTMGGSPTEKCVMVATLRFCRRLALWSLYSKMLDLEEMKCTGIVADLRI